ncbi:MAG: hypothetical protein O3B65_01005 [Chloroflexi bacterium]|nr:hypothetical protein [Chloroflexota bacterium]
MSTSAVRVAQRLLSDADLAFVTNDEQRRWPDPNELRLSLAHDEPLRSEILGDDRLFRRVLNLDDALIRVSPRLFFEILLRRAVLELSKTAHVREWTGAERVPVFIGEGQVQAVARPAVIDYLSDMLASFTKVNSHTARVRVRRGVWRKTRYSDLDVPSLLRLASESDEADRQPLYKRATDASLLILGMFPEFAASATRYPGTGALRRRGGRLSTEEYEHVAAKAYKLVAEDPTADAWLSEAALVLSDHVIDAKRPLNHVAEQYLRIRRDDFFTLGA